MSLYHENFVWPLHMQGLKKLVLCYVARQANLKTGEAHVTILDVSYQTGMSDSAVRNFLKELELDGHVTRVPTPGKRLNYRVNLGDRQCSV
ncbi:hypothetical protein [Paraburkholderia sp. GAS82]|uniref:hypothetical protein n=1 Tax=Paraburkholderia sp. GAS82 TaxID=3035137 RepID=UPI003D238960